LLALALVAPTAPAAEPKPVVVPFTLVETGHFLVDVKINGKGPFKLIFDTGAPTMLINNRLAKASGVVNSKTSRPLFAPFGAMGPQTIGTVQIGEVTADKVSAMVMDHPTVSLFSRFFEKKHGPIDGIVGFPFFARYKMTVDYQAKELTFVPNGYKPADVMQSMMNSLMAASQSAGKPRVVGPAGQWGLRVEKSTDDEDPGVRVAEVLEGSAAAAAGVKVDDRILTLDGRWTDSIAECYQAAAQAQPGKPAVLTVQRDGKELKLTVTPRRGI
jgi:hypothetical protein